MRQMPLLMKYLQFTNGITKMFSTFVSAEKTRLKSYEEGLQIILIWLVKI